MEGSVLTVPRLMASYAALRMEVELVTMVLDDVADDGLEVVLQCFVQVNRIQQLLNSAQTIASNQVAEFMRLSDAAICAAKGKSGVTCRAGKSA